MIKRHYVLLAFSLFFLFGCGPSDQSKEERQSTDAKILAENRAAERQLLADTNRATSQLIQRLRASVKMSDGFLMVDNLSYTRLLAPQSETATASIPGAFSLSVRRPESPWVVNCGMGITVVFGNPTSEEAKVIVNGDKVWLTYIPVPKQACEKLAPIIAKEIQAILSGG